ncbi:HAD family hydrolase [Streptomyces thinghirensis]|nr:HAD family hydrolase [Streptomyces thinghirensis]
MLESTRWRVDTVVLDKTGTVTTGRTAPHDVHATEGAPTEAEVLRLAGAVEHASEHPVARADRGRCRGAGRRAPDAENFGERPRARRVHARVEGREVAVGRLYDALPPEGHPRQGRGREGRSYGRRGRLGTAWRAGSSPWRTR